MHHQNAAAAQAAREWNARIEQADAELQGGALGPADGAQATQARMAVERARAVVAALAGGQEAIKAEYPGARATPPRAGALEQWMHGAAAPHNGKREPAASPSRDTPPRDALRWAKQSRDAVLRLGVWSVLGDAQARALPSCVALVAARCGAAASVPPGIAPTPAWAETADAQAFFGGHLRSVIAEVAEACNGQGAAFATWLDAAPMNRTVASAQRWSGLWSDLVCAVYADWLDRRGAGSIAAARASLWQANGGRMPVRFRPGPGRAAIPTKGHRIHVDLWLQAVLAQVLAHDPARWHEAPLDGRWHAVRLAIHDLGARDVGDAADGPRTLHRGLSIEMLYAAIFIERAGGAQEVSMNASIPAADVAQRFEVLVPGCAPGQQATLRVILEWSGSRAERGEPGGSARRRDALAQVELDSAQREAIQAWRAQRGRRERDAGVQTLDAVRLDWQVAPAAASEGARLVLGHFDLWGAIDGGALWCDIAVVVHHADRWTALPVEMVDGLIDGSLRTWLVLDADDAAALRAQGVDAQHIGQGLASAAASLWVARQSGLGVFVSIGVELLS